MKIVPKVLGFSKLSAVALFVVPIVCMAADGAAPTTVAELASSVNFKDVTTAILAIAGTIVALYATWKGAQFIIRQVRGA